MKENHYLQVNISFLPASMPFDKRLNSMGKKQGGTPKP